MSRYSYHGEYVNPADSYFVKEIADGRFAEGVRFEIWVRSRERNRDGSIDADRKGKFRFNNSFTDQDAAEEAIDSIHEFFEDDYDNYLEEHHDEIVWQERYEQYRNEY